MSTGTGFHEVVSGADTIKVAVINRGLDFEATIPEGAMDDPELDGVLVLTYRPEEVAGVIDETVICPSWPCSWYATDDNTENGARYYQVGDLLRTRIRLDLTTTPGQEANRWMAPSVDTQDAWENTLSTARDWQRTLNTIVDGIDGTHLRHTQLKFEKMEFTPLGTVDGVFQKYGIEVKCRAGGRYQPLWEIRVKNSSLAAIDGVALNQTWDKRSQGVYLENDVLAERISTGWDEDGKAIPPKQFMEHGDPRRTGTTAGSHIVDKLVDVNRQQDKLRFAELIRPTKFSQALDGITDKGVGLAGFGLIIGSGMIFSYSMSEDGFWEGAILTGQSAADLFVEIDRRKWGDGCAFDKSRSVRYADGAGRESGLERPLGLALLPRGSGRFLCLSICQYRTSSPKTALCPEDDGQCDQCGSGGCVPVRYSALGVYSRSHDGCVRGVEFTRQRVCGGGRRLGEFGREPEFKCESEWHRGVEN